MVRKVGHQALAELGKEHALPILQALFVRGWMSASEVANDISVHISTAQAYLEAMRAQGLLESRERPGRKGLVEYSILDGSIQVDIDIGNMVQDQAKTAFDRAGLLKIRERKGAPVSYEWDEAQRTILSLNIMKRSKAFGRVGVARSIKLTQAEGRFLWHLPQATEDRKTVVQIAQEAEISNPFDMIRIVELVEMLAMEKILDVKKGGS
jgi:hypothetical protein